MRSSGGTSWTWLRAVVATVLVGSALVVNPGGAASETGAADSAATELHPELAFAQQVLDVAQNPDVDPSQRAIDTARFALDHRRGQIDAELLPLLDQQARNLDTAEELLALGDPDEENALEYGIAAAKVATGWQAATLGLDLAAVEIETPDHGSPSEAALALVEHAGGEVSGSQLAELQTLDELPEPAQVALTDFIDAFIGFSIATDLAYADADMERIEALLEAMDDPEAALELVDSVKPDALLADLGIDLTPVLAARNALLDAVAPLRDALLEPGAQQQSAAAPIQVAPVLSIELGTATNNSYSQDFMLLIDVGGDDTYLNNAGGGALFRPAAALVDLQGSDQYRSLRDLGINGGGAAGAGLLIDALGTDIYRAGHGGTNGGGWLGVGFLLDAIGEDEYTGTDTATNGGGNLGGIGMLIDSFNGDSYFATNGGTNGGGSLAGVGFLLDTLSPNTFSAGSEGTNGGAFTGGVGFLTTSGLAGDIYAAGSFGTNGGAGGLSGPSLATGGVGFLLDGAGSDSYSAGSGGTNGGGEAGAGVLLDGAGHDHATAGGSATNGGSRLGAGTFINIEGNDQYHGTSGGVNGGGWGGAALLLDANGSDVYSGGSTATNGAGTFGGTGALLEGTGNDRYTGENGNGSLGTGLLFDAGGTDRYRPNSSSTFVFDETVVPKGLVGAQIDAPTVPVPPTTLPTLPTTTTTSIPLPPTTTTSVPLPTTTSVPLPPTTTTSIPLPTTTTSTVPPPPNLFTGYASNDCDTDPDHTVVNVQDGTAYAKLRTKTVGSETWVCFALDGGSGTAHIGGKAVVDTTETLVDNEQAACHQDGEPPFPRHFEGTFGPNNTPVHLDVITVDDGPGFPNQQIWVCSQVDTVARRLIIPGSVVRYVPDDLEHTDPPTTTTSSTTTSSTTTTTTPPPPAGEPSRHCLDNGGDELVNEPVGSGRLWVYTHESGSETSACVRYETGTGQVVGGRLVVDTAGSQTYLEAQNRSDFTTDPEYGPDGPCDVNVVNITSDPELIVKFRDPAHGSPAFLCVRADETFRRIKVTAPADQSFVTWDADSDSAVPSDGT